MEKRNKSLLWFLVALFIGAYYPAFTQDDVYYDPTHDTPASGDYRDDDNSSYDNGDSRSDNDNSGYDDEYYNGDDDEYAYQYSSRIRRFHRPTVIVDYYDPFYVDLWQYDPYFLPGASIYSYGYNDYYTWRRWHRWHRYDPWYNPYTSYGGCGYNSWGYNNYGGGWNQPWGNTFVVNNYYYDPYWTWNGYNPYYNDGYNNNYYNNGNNYQNGNGNGYKPQTYTGPRRGGGTSVNPGYASINNNGRNGRLVAEPQKNTPSIDLSTRKNTRVITSDREPAAPTQDVNRPGAKSSRAPAATAPTQQSDRKTDKSSPGRSTSPAGREQQQEARPGQRNPETTEPQRESTPGRRTEQRRESPTDARPAPSERPSRRSYDEPSRSERKVEREPAQRPGSSERSTQERPSRSERTESVRPGRSESPRSNDSGGSSRSSSDSSTKESKNSSPSSGKRGRN